MALKANYEFLFVGRDENSFLENYAYDLFQDFGEKSGQIFVNLEVQNNPVDAEEIGRAVFETMREVFFEDVTKDPYERFETALKAVNDVLAEFKTQKFSGYIGNLNIIAAAIVGNVLYLTQSGDAEAYLIRKKYISVVSEGLGDEGSGNEVFASIASGSIESGDFVLFSSTRLLRYISKTDLAKSFSKKDVNKCLEDLRDLISTEILGRVGLTGIGFVTAEKEEVAQIEKEIDTATQNILESQDDDYASVKQTLTGKFFTAIKSYKKKSDGRESAGKVLQRIVSWFKNFWKGLFMKGFGKDKILALLVVAIILLIGGITWGRANSEERARIAELDKTLVSVQEKISEAETRSAFDKEAAKTILDQAYADAKEVLDSGYFREKAGMLILSIDEARDSMDNVKRITAPKVLADLSEKRSDVNALGLVQVNGRIFAYEYNALYEVVLDQVQDPLTIDEDETVIAATGFDERGSIVFLTKSGNLIEYSNGTMNFMDTEDGSFRKGTAIEDWSNRIYILDPAANQIWRYAYRGTTEKFTSAEAYISGEVDLAKAQDLAIDASVYVLETTADILKFYGGTKAEFTIDNPPFNTPKDPRVIYTDDRLDTIYVVDGAGSRVLAFEKNSQTGNATYTTQYLFEGIGEIRDVFVDPNSNKMYVLTASKIYELDI